MQIKKCFWALLMIASLLCSVNMTVFAHEVPDDSRRGSISITMMYDETAVSGGTLTLYQVGAVAEDDGNYSFVLSGRFTQSGLDISNISSADLAEKLERYAQSNSLVGTTVEIGRDGKAMFSNVRQGLYLIAQNKAADGYEKITPFLVSVPNEEDDRYIYDVDATPKLSTLTKTKPKPATPNTPTEPSLPQTGQLNWPVPVLAALGLLLFAIGCVLRSRPREEQL